LPEVVPEPAKLIAHHSSKQEFEINETRRVERYIEKEDNSIPTPKGWNYSALLPEFEPLQYGKGTKRPNPLQEYMKEEKRPPTTSFSGRHPQDEEPPLTLPVAVCRPIDSSCIAMKTWSTNFLLRPN